MGCLAIVGQNKILTHPGLVLNINDLKVGRSYVDSDDIGKKVEVRAIRKSFNHYTFVEDKTLYIKVIEN